MSQKIRSNFFYQASYQLTMMLLPVMTVPIVSKAIGVTGLGTWNFMYAIATYFMQAGSLGLANYGVREIAIVKKDKLSLSEKFWELEFFNAFFSLGTLVIYLVMCLFLPDKELYIMLALAVLSVLFDITWFFTGIEEFKRVTQLTTCLKLISFVCILIFVQEEDDLGIYFMIQATTMLVNQLLFWFFLKGKIIFVRVTVKGIWQHFIPSLAFFMTKLSSTLFANLNKTILGVMAGMSVVGIYSNSVMLVLMASSLMNALNIVMIPHMSSLNSRKNEKELINTLQESIHIQFYFTIAIMFGIIATNQQLIGWFFGGEFKEMTQIVPFLAVTAVLQTFYTGIASQYLIPKGELRSYNYSLLIGIAVSIILDVSLIPLLGIAGAVIGQLMGQLVVCLIRGIILVRETGFTFQVRRLSLFLLAGGAMAGIVMWLTKNMAATPLTSIVQLILGISLYLGLTAKISPLNPIQQKKVRKLPAA